MITAINIALYIYKLLVGVVKGKMGNKLSYPSVDLSSMVTGYGGNTARYWLSGIAKVAMAQKNTDDNIQ